MASRAAKDVIGSGGTGDGRVLSEEEISVMRQYFNQFDIDGDGVISAKELRKASQRLGYRLTEQQLDTIMKLNDINSDGKLNFEEFLRAMPTNMITISADEHKMAEVRRKFSEFDLDGNGIVTATEAHEILEKELAFSPSQSADMVARYDVNGDGQLGFEEFVQFYSKVQDSAQKVRRLFDEYDKDRSGSISMKEAGSLFARLGLMDKVKVRDLISQYDVDGDGELQYYEFVALVMNYTR